MTRAVFWSCGFLLAYTYAVFPVLVLARARLRQCPWQEADITPRLTVIVAARNEAASIGAKIESLLALDYPAERLEVVIASDGSEDATEEIVARAADPRVRLIALPRVGKAGALNAAVASATGEILVFSDANSRFAPEALRALVRPFADPSVGGVAGDQRYSRPGAEDAMGVGERQYWDFDRLLKDAESRSGSVVSATGAIYALRTELFESVPDGVTDDFFVSTGVIARGKRLVFVGAAFTTEPVSGSGKEEFGRKERIITRGLRGVLARRALLDPRRHGFYAVQLFSHKVLRRAMAVPLVGLAASAVFLQKAGGIYRVAAAGQTVFYGLAALGLLLRNTHLGRSKVLALPAFFVLANVASLVGVWNVLRGKRIDRWEPTRSRQSPD